MNIQNKKEEMPKFEHVSPFTRNIVDIKELNSILKPGYNHGVCGGHNLGNTCFMNSSIACLSNCTELTTYFLNGSYKNDINKNNKEGLYGKMANAWYDLLKEYWMSSARTGNPSNVKATISKKVRKFRGFNQQDSNEFMTEFLSLLSEDLNKTNKKEYRELKEKQDSESDIQCAGRFWRLHLQRNDSIISDLFSGLLKSEVICNDCGFDNITFDPFDTLTLAIPENRKLFDKASKLFDDIELFYIPKYCIKDNLRVRLRVKKECPLKEVLEKLKELKDFNFNIKNMKFIQVSDGKLKRFIDENEFKKENEYVFMFDDESEEGEKNIIVPLYMNKNNKNSAFPRLLFLKENNNFGDLKRKIYYFARNYIKSPFNNEEINEISELDKELKIYKSMKKSDNYDEHKLFELYSKEYDDIFHLKEEDINKEKKSNFLEDFPYIISIKNKYEDKEEIILFDGKNNLDNLKICEISNDEEPITKFLNKLEKEEYYLFLTFKKNSKYSINNIKIDSCEAICGPDYNKKEKLTLDNLSEYFCFDEYLDKGNEWSCNKCKKKVKVKKKLSIYFVPRILIICLNRFSRGNNRFYAKNGELIDFPLENLDMGKYVCGPDDRYSKYDLFAVSQHFGGTGGGHYTAVCKNYDGNWYDYNDSSCRLTSPNNIVSSSAYVLFYRKQNW